MASWEEDGNITDSIAACLCSDLQHEDYSPLYAWFNYIVIIILLPMLCLFGVLTNTLNVFIYSRRRMRNPANTYLLFLSLSDSMVIVTGLFIFWVDSARSYISELASSPYTTVYVLPIGYMAQTCSIYITVAAAVDCYINVCWEGFAKRHCTIRRARIIVAAIVLCSILYNSLRFPQFNLRTCYHEGSREEIVEICPTDLFFTINTIYNTYLYMVLMTLLPFFFLLILNVFIVMKKSSETCNGDDGGQLLERTAISMEASIIQPQAVYRGLGPLNNGALSTKHKPMREAPRLSRASIRTDAKRCPQHHLKDSRRSLRSLARRQESIKSPMCHRRRLSVSLSLRSFRGVTIQTREATTDDTLVMIMVVVLFLACNILALVVNLIETFFEPDALLLNLLSDASNFLVILNSSVNAIIYCAFNEEYRRLFIRNCHATKRCLAPIFHSWIRKDRTASDLDSLANLDARNSITMGGPMKVSSIAERGNTAKPTASASNSSAWSRSRISQKAPATKQRDASFARPFNPPVNTNGTLMMVDDEILQDDCATQSTDATTSSLYCVANSTSAEFKPTIQPMLYASSSMPACGPQMLLYVDLSLSSTAV